MIEHDKSHHRFVLRCGKYEAALMYAVKGDILDFYHIYTPDPFRGGDVSTSILKHAFDYARDNGYHVVPSCPYIAEPFWSDSRNTRIWWMMVNFLLLKRFETC